MHSKSNNIEIVIHDEGDEAVKEPLGSLKNRYVNNLESTKGSEFPLIMLSYRIINVAK